MKGYHGRLFLIVVSTCCSNTMTIGLLMAIMENFSLIHSSLVLSNGTNTPYYVVLSRILLRLSGITETCLSAVGVYAFTLESGPGSNSISLTMFSFRHHQDLSVNPRRVLFHSLELSPVLDPVLQVEHFRGGPVVVGCYAPYGYRRRTQLGTGGLQDAGQDALAI